VRNRKPDTLLLQLPNGEKVRVWRRDAEKIRADYLATGNVFIARAPGDEVYSRIDPTSIEAAALNKHARRVTSSD
jgi:hypothetical protein